MEDYERVKRIVRTFEIDLDKPGAEARVIFSRNERDAYHDPGTPVLKTTPTAAARSSKPATRFILSGEGSSPTGDNPFLDRFNLATGKAQRLFQSDEQRVRRDRGHAGR